MRILITGVCGPAGAAFSRKLRELGHWVMGVDLLRRCTIDIDAFQTVVPVEHPGYVGEISALAVRHRIELVVPTISEELPLIADAVAGQRFAATGCTVVVGGSHPVAVCADKHRTMLALAAARVPVPSFARADRFHGPFTADISTRRPVIVKPRTSRGGRGVMLVFPNAMGVLSVPEDASLLVQSFAPGIEYSPTLFRNPETRRIEACVVVEKTKLREGNIGNAVSVARRDDPHPAFSPVSAVARAAAEALDLTGPIDLDIRLTAAGDPVVLEVNARLGANSAAAPELVAALLAFAEERTRRSVAA